MSKITILDTDYATLWYYPETKIVHHILHKFTYGAEFRNYLERGLEVIQKYGAQKWLSDDRHHSALPTEDLEWSMNDWFFRAFNSGWKYWAMIMPDKVVGQMNMNRIMERNINLGMNIRVFESPEEALQWLESIDMLTASPANNAPGENGGKSE